MTLLTDLDFKTKKATKPPTRWRNWWWTDTGRWSDGDTTNPIFDPGIYPSKDAAESAAEHQLSKMPRCKWPFYIGAIPESENTN